MVIVYSGKRARTLRAIVIGLRRSLLFNFDQCAFATRCAAVRKEDVCISDAIFEIIDMHDMLTSTTGPINHVNAIANWRNVNINCCGIFAVRRSKDHLLSRPEVKAKLLVAEIDVIRLTYRDEISIACGRDNMRISRLCVNHATH